MRIAGVVLGVLLALRLAAPVGIAWTLERGLSQRVDAPVEVAELEVDVLQPGFVATGIRTLHGEGVADLDIERVEAGWAWGELVRLDVRTTLSVIRPKVVLDLDASRAKVPTMKGVEIDRLASFRIVDGLLDIAIDTASGRSELRLSDVQVGLTATAWDAGRHANVEASAQVGDTGSLEAKGRVDSAVAAQDWDFEFMLDDLDLRPLNAVWLDLLEMDVDRGRLDVSGRLRRTRDRLRGELSPRFEELRFLGQDESARHGMGEALFGHMLAGADSTIEIDRDIGTGTGATLAEIFDTDWEELVAGIIQRGYSRRLGTLQGYDATIGDVQVHFDDGLVVLERIVLTRNTRRVPVPFLSVQRLEVLFDPQVADADGDEAFKHIVMWEPELTLVKGLDDDRSQLRFDPDWVDKISAMPFKTRDVIVHDGRISYWDDTENEPIRFFVSDVELVGTEMARGLCEPGTRGALLSGSGKTQGVASTSIAVSYEPAADDANAEVTFSVDAVPLEQLEPLLRAKAGVEVEDGAFELHGQVVAESRHVEATIRPRVYGVRLEAVDDGRRVREFAKNLIERRLRRLGGRTLEIAYDYGPDEKAFSSFGSLLVHVAVRRTKRKNFFIRGDGE
jgi:hypothetical protein